MERKSEYLDIGAVEVHTLRYGAPDYADECYPTLDKWAAKCGYTLRVHDGHGFEPRQFSKVGMMREFLRGGADWFAFVDGDCVMHPDAPPLGEVVDGHGLYALIDLESTARKWRPWLQANRIDVRDHTYRNSGVFIADRATVGKLLAGVREPFIKGFLEQHQFNVWFANSGITVRDLPDRWNSFRDRAAPAWCFHLAGHRKMEKIADLRKRARIPDAVKRPSRTPRIHDFGDGAVVWPWKSSAAEWDELRYSAASVKRFWSERGWPLVIFGDKRPEWWDGEFVEAVSYEDALYQGVQCAKNVLWMNDDIILLDHQSPETFGKAREMGDMAERLGETMVAMNAWRRGLGQVLMRLHHHGKPVRNFSTHTPYLYQRDKAAEVLDLFGVFHKIPFETAYHNWHGTPWSECSEKSKGPHDLRGKLWINPSFRQVTPEFRRDLDCRFQLRDIECRSHCR